MRIESAARRGLAVNPGRWPPSLLLLLILGVNGAAIGLAYLVLPTLAAGPISQFVGMFTHFKLQPIALSLLLLGGVLLTEVLVMGWRNASLYRLLRPSRSARNDLVVWSWHALGFGWPVTILFTFGLALFVQRASASLLDFKLLGFVDSPLLQFLIWLTIVDFASYWYHRWVHEIGFLWATHKFHHSATEFNVITGSRMHVLDDAAWAIVKIVPMAVLGAPAQMIASVILARTIVNTLQHSMLPWDYGWVGRWLLYSPVRHRIHHSMEREHWDKNYGDIFPIWDRIFGTWYAGDRFNTEVGVTDNPYNRKGVLADYMSCYVRTVTVLWESIRSGRWRRIDADPQADSQRAPAN